MSVLTDFLQYQDNLPSLELVQQVKQDDLTISSYRFYSQKWPIHPSPAIPSTNWVHNLILYIPATLEHKQVLLYVGGGYNADKEGHASWAAPYEKMNFANNKYLFTRFPNVTVTVRIVLKFLQ